MTELRRGLFVLTAFLGLTGCLSDHCEAYPKHCVTEQADDSGGAAISDTNTDTGDSSDSGTDDSSDLDTEDTDDNSDTDDNEPPEAPALELSFSQVKQFEFSWSEVLEAEYYQLLESVDVGEDFVLISDAIVGESIALTVPLHFRANASYKLQACNDNGCSKSAIVDVAGTLVEAVGYLKASNTDASDAFGNVLALSADGTTMAVGAYQEASNAKGINSNQDNNSAYSAGAVYVFVRNGQGQWEQQAYVKASNTGIGDRFGVSVALSGDGTTLAVGAHDEKSNAVGIDGNQADNSFESAGAAYVFVRNGEGQWEQQAYVKASNTGAGDSFGWRVALSGDGSTLAVGARFEDSNAVGINGNQADNSSGAAGAVYVFVRNGQGQWSQQAYVKASNTNANDRFGWSVALSGDGSTLAAGAYGEDSNAVGINGDQTNNSASDAGAAYIFVRNGQGQWSQQAYVKASNVSHNFGWSAALSEDGSTLIVGAYSAATGGTAYVFVRNGQMEWEQQTYVKSSNEDDVDHFGWSVTLSGDGNTLAVGAWGEDSNAMGINGNQANNSASDAGAAYVFVRNKQGQWEQQAYVKAPNTGTEDRFGTSVALTGDGSTLAVGAPLEDSIAKGIGGNQADNSASSAGAVYLY